MKRILSSKLYDTDTATSICRLAGSPDSTRDYRGHRTFLYKSPGGTFFIAGEGNARSMWAEQLGPRSWAPGSGMRLVSEEEARGYAEDAGLRSHLYEEAFGAVPMG